ncbi:prephenate dehydrogenase [Papillibacter cinnamivorans]|uniref:Prephenate dehydrogenase n=1 Tax=Papillibacter cinnamivorans DSM 12816 TaxID=1122930 RepID=A0A1W2BTN9_9FIRM|nr:prephenate dehydrogenase/arogenate dehydrogenase family protein [Papillibacter cinnamivorans]SMC76259.1 prephenate dehydrogenase [Papillibacter cinnamivorans DSM 12816]
MGKTIVIIGLGLIGGSMAMALRGFEDSRLVGVDTDPETLRFAVERGAVDEAAENAETVLGRADLVFLCLRPEGIIRFMEKYAGQFRSGAVVTDVAGIKGAIVAAARCLPDTVEFIGGHPMAGRETSGIQNADGRLFRGAHYIVTPSEKTTPSALALMERIARHIGCRDLVQTKPEEHDEIIAYTSQVMHVMAVAICDDPVLFRCRGFEGGSFRDCTRVAALDVPLWTELFSLNAGALTGVLSRLEGSLKAYREALETGDRESLSEKLRYSSDRKRHMNLE